MPALKSPRHEAMARNLALGMTQLKAYADAGFSGKTKGAATQVANRKDVQDRVRELQAAQHTREMRSNEIAIDKAAIDKGYIVERLKYAAEFGLRGRPLLDDKGQPTGKWSVKPDIRGATGALRTLAQMGGYLVDRVEIGNPGDFTRMTDDELNSELITIGTNIGLDERALQKAIGYTPGGSK